MTAAVALLGMSSCTLLLGLLFNLLSGNRSSDIDHAPATQLERMGAARTQAAIRLARPMIAVGTIGIVASALILLILTLG